MKLTQDQILALIVGTDERYAVAPDAILELYMATLARISAKLGEGDMGELVAVAAAIYQLSSDEFMADIDRAALFKKVQGNSDERRWA